MEHNEMLIIAGIVAGGILCQWFAWRIKIPAILPLLAAGFLVGPVLGLLHPQEEFENFFFPIVSLAVAIILFEGALTLTWREVREVRTTVRNLLSIGAAVSLIGGALAAHYIVGTPWELAFLFGALIIVTGPTVIAPILRNVRPTEKVASVLRWEGILIDPIGALVAVLIFEFIVAGTSATFGDSLLMFVRIVGIGTALGLAGGYLIYVLLQRYLIPDYLRDTAVLAAVISVFAVSSTLAPESGLLAVTVMGVFLANTDLKKLREIWYFKEKISVLLISSLFILLAANVRMADIKLLDWRSLIVLGVVILLLRPIGVALSAWGGTLSRNERLFLSWVAPRGIVAAAVSSLFVFELVELGIVEARILTPLIFMVIVGTVVIQGGTAKYVGRWLGVSEADPQGFLLMGASALSQELALVLQEEGYVVRLIDANLANVSEARMRGLRARQGNLLSDFVETDVDLSGIGRLLALTNNDEANALACKHFEDEFGSSEVYQLPPHLSEGLGTEPNRYQLGRLLFAQGATYECLQDMLNLGGVLKKTPLTQQFDWDDFRKQYEGSKVVLMMAIRGDEILVSTVDNVLVPEAGWTLISLVLEPDAEPLVLSAPSQLSALPV
ncbi:MAG: cation:proton antiporter [Caldilineaceae bacterium]